MMAVLRFLADLFYPPRCMLCHRIMESSGAALCGRCDFELPEYEGVSRNVAYFEQTVAPFYYEEPIRSAILRLKFRGMQDYVDQFAAWMAVWVRDKLEGEFDMISWVPCSRKRKWKRGFDQAELLAKALAKQLNRQAVRTLVKHKNNQAQSRLHGAAQRKANVIGAYRVYHPERFRGKRILLVDDVLTTGSTLSECGKTLQMGGAGALVCAVIAVTKPEEDK